MDGIISIAVLHHISSRERRLGLLAEMGRLMKPGARGLVTVWASEQEDKKKLAKWESLGHDDASGAGIGPAKLAKCRSVRMLNCIFCCSAHLV